MAYKEKWRGIPLQNKMEFSPKQRELYSVLVQIRDCQNLCRESQRSTFVGGFSEFTYAHNLLERVEREQPIERQKRLIPVMRQLAEELSREEQTAVLDEVDKDCPLR